VSARCPGGVALIRTALESLTVKAHIREIADCLPSHITCTLERKRYKAGILQGKCVHPKCVSASRTALFLCIIASDFPACICKR